MESWSVMRPEGMYVFHVRSLVGGWGLFGLGVVEIQREVSSHGAKMAVF